MCHMSHSWRIPDRDKDNIRTSASSSWIHQHAHNGGITSVTNYLLFSAFAFLANLFFQASSKIISCPKANKPPIFNGWTSIPDGMKKNKIYENPALSGIPFLFLERAFDLFKKFNAPFSSILPLKQGFFMCVT